jgi:hypothetical protein
MSLLTGTGGGPRDGLVVIQTGVVHLLVVEDDAAIADPMVDGLARSGFEVSRVAIGQGALGGGLDVAVTLEDG